MTYLIRIKLYYEHHPHTSGLHNSKYCVMPDTFGSVKGRAMPDYAGAGREESLVHTEERMRA